MCEQCRCKQDADKAMWAAVIRGLLAVVRAVEKRYPELDTRHDQRRAA